MKHLDLFTGILGFAYAAKQVWRDEYQLIACCEKDKFCQELIRKRAPGVPVFDDIRTLTKDCINEPIDIITGGFPCQPFSIAGKQQGKEDDRYLWEEMLRVVAEIRPTWVIGENVTGIIKLALDDVLASLENEGYTTETYIIPAAGVGAPHIRERVWIVGHNDSKRQHNWQIGKIQGRKQIAESLRGDANVANTNSDNDFRKVAGSNGKKAKIPGEHWQKNSAARKLGGTIGDVADTKSAKRKLAGDSRHRRNGFANNYSHDANTNGERCEKRDIAEKPGGQGFSAGLSNPEWNRNWMEAATAFCRVDDGVSRRVDRLRALGNAIVPQVAMQIFEAIKLHEMQRAS